MPVSPVPAGPPDPVHPDYGGACLTSLGAALLSETAREKARGAPPPEWLPVAAHGANQIVLLVLDGLGWEQLVARPKLAPVLTGADGIEGWITSVAPTTTACALTSVATGRPPCDHGLFGYRLAARDTEIMNVLKWTLGTVSQRDARQALPASTFQPYPPFPGASHPVPVITRSEFGGTGFTAAHLGSSPLRGYRVVSSLIVGIRRALSAGEPFMYAYYDGIDKVAHEHGLDEHYDAELKAVDSLVGDIAAELPPGAALVVTADHGQIDVGTNVELLGSEMMEGIAFMSGEGRFRWLHVRRHAQEDLYAIATELYRASTWVMTRDELVDGGWFGGPLRDGIIGRLGDIALVPHAPIAFLDPADTGETRLQARHGSLTRDEMLVPLVTIARDGTI
ncbi:MAG: alkaline phosphatase family protein [Acidimicrobiales bacterium]